MSDHSNLWEAITPSAPARPALPHDVDADVVIVGAGFTGLWTAYYLAEADPSLRIVVLEAETVGHGASGRNGGWCSSNVAGLDVMLADPVSRAAGAALQREMIHTVTEVGRVVGAENIGCDYERGGTVVVAAQATQVSRLKEAIEVRREAGFGPEDFRWMDARETSTRIRPAINMGASFTPHTAVLNPLALVRGLAAAVERLGVKIYERTRATAIASSRVVTDRGRVTGTAIVRATEAYTALLPGSKREVVPVYSLMVATPQLDPGVWDEIGLQHRESFSDGRRLIIYGQRTADGRIAFGGRGAPYHYGSSIDPEHDQDDAVFAGLAEGLGAMFPVLGEVDIDYAWGGALAITRDWLASILFDRDTGLGRAGGYAGQGVAAANLAGRCLRDLILERDSDLLALPMVGHVSPLWELEPIRWLGINTGLRMTVGTDAMEQRSGVPAKWRARTMKRLIGL
jgi:glycine/D-amino acid oxidase-like deaminating enzyme